jgi:hypothetical protein
MRSDAREDARAVSPRSWSAVAVGACYEVGVIALFAIAYRLEPSPTGIGTHTQLGLPPCLIHQVTGVPCPACGMTTAFAHAVHGNPVLALVAQPFAALIALALAVGFIVFPIAIYSGRSPKSVARAVFTERLATVYLALLVLSWVYKIASTSFLR